MIRCAPARSRLRESAGRNAASMSVRSLALLLALSAPAHGKKLNVLVRNHGAGAWGGVGASGSA